MALLGDYSLLAAAAGLTSCTVFVTMNTTMNFIALPCYMLAPLPKSKADPIALGTYQSSSDVILRQWETTYARGHTVGPGSAIFSTIAFLYAARTTADTLGLRAWFYVAATCAGMAIPFTVLFMFPTNDELLRRTELVRKGSGVGDASRSNETQEKGKGKENADSEVQGDDTLTLIRKWHFLSKIRAVTPLPAIVVAFYAIARKAGL
jgi:hypothetical protein